MPKRAIDAPRSTRPPSQTPWRGRAMHNRAPGGTPARGGGYTAHFVPVKIEWPYGKGRKWPTGSPRWSPRATCLAPR